MDRRARADAQISGGSQAWKFKLANRAWRATRGRATSMGDSNLTVCWVPGEHSGGRDGSIQTCRSGKGEMQTIPMERRSGGSTVSVERERTRPKELPRKRFQERGGRGKERFFQASVQVGTTAVSKPADEGGKMRIISVER